MAISSASDWQEGRKRCSRFGENVASENGVTKGGRGGIISLESGATSQELGDEDDEAE